MHSRFLMNLWLKNNSRPWRPQCFGGSTMGLTYSLSHSRSFSPSPSAVAASSARRIYADPPGSSVQCCTSVLAMVFRSIALLSSPYCRGHSIWSLSSSWQFLRSFLHLNRDSETAHCSIYPCILLSFPKHRFFYPCACPSPTPSSKFFLCSCPSKPETFSMFPCKWPHSDSSRFLLRFRRRNLNSEQSQHNLFDSKMRMYHFQSYLQ